MPQEYSKLSGRPPLQWYFRDPRFAMSVPGRLAVRIMRSVSYLFLIALALTLVFSDVSQLWWTGVFLILFTADVLLHRRLGDYPITRLIAKGGGNAAKGTTPGAFLVLERAFDRSALTSSSFFLEAVLQLSGVKEIREGLRRLDIPLEAFKQKAEELLAQSKAGGAVPRDTLLEQVQALALASVPQALANGHEYIEPADLAGAFPGVGDGWSARLFDVFALRPGDIRKAVFLASRRKRLRQKLFSGSRRLAHHIVNRAWTSRITPLLDGNSDDLTDLARVGAVGFLIGHEGEYRRLFAAISRPLHPNAILVGEAGSGREALVGRLAYDIIRDSVPPALFDKRLVKLHIERLVAGADAGEIAKRVQGVAQEIATAGNVILYIPDMHNLLQTSGAAYLSAADALMPVVMNDTFPVIGATYPAEFKKHVEPRSDITGSFEVIRMEEVSEEEAQELLLIEARFLEAEHRVRVAFTAVREAVALAARYLRPKFLPGSAIEVLKEAVARAVQSGEKAVSGAQVAALVEEKVHVPLREASEDEAQALLNLEDIIHADLVGQDAAVTAVSQALREYRSGLKEGKGPIATFLFVGPTGVGKTELAKVVAKVQFGSADAIVRFDMSEFHDEGGVERFVGSADRRVPGLLTEAVRQHPYCLILLDEFEKAHPQLLNVFLPVFDEGRLTDGVGRDVDFRNTIIIATSNAKADLVEQALREGKSVASVAEYLKQKLSDVFRPELLNRFTNIVVFRNLEIGQLRQIVRRHLEEFAASVAAKGITLSFDETAVEQLAREGFDPLYGARPLVRTIENRIRAPLAELLLEKKVRQGSRVKAVVNGKDIDFVPLDS
jgi:ATP-dependent Clp protease ATP-binding subunit ClpC